MSVLTSPKTYTALALLQAGDAAACAARVAPIEKALAEVNFPLEYRWILVGSKAASVGACCARRAMASRGAGVGVSSMALQLPC